MPIEIKEINIEDLMIETPEITQEGVVRNMLMLEGGYPIEPIVVSYCTHKKIYILDHGKHRVAAKYFFRGEKTILAEVELCTDIYPCVGEDGDSNLYKVQDLVVVNFDKEIWKEEEDSFCEEIGFYWINRREVETLNRFLEN